jgi:hypothetical protein
MLVYEHQSIFSYNFSESNNQEDLDERNHKLNDGIKSSNLSGHYVNRVLNKIIPEFFAKKNNNEPIEIDSLPF